MTERQRPELDSIARVRVTDGTTTYARRRIKFPGATLTDDSVNETVTVTISSGSTSGDRLSLGTTGSPQSVASGGPVHTILFGTATIFEQVGTSISVVGDTLTIGPAGIYAVSASVQFVAKTGGTERQASLLEVGGNGFVYGQVAPTTSNTSPDGDIVIPLALTYWFTDADAVGVQVLQDSGSNQDVGCLVSVIRLA